MSREAGSPVTQLLVAVGQGEAGARERLWEAVYDELRSVARHQMADEATGHTLQPTALVNEAFLRLVGEGKADWSSRRHFFGAAARAMRRICIDHARTRNRLKRGAGQHPGRLVEEPAVSLGDPAEMLAVDEALDKLEQEEPRQAEVVMLRYFVGLTEEETATALGVSRRTVQTDWRMARAWLHRELSDGDTWGEG